MSLIQTAPDIMPALKDPRVGIYVAIPNMIDVNSGLARILLDWGSNPAYKLIVHYMAENRHHDYARNRMVEDFLKTDAEYILFIDADVNPNPQLLRLAEHGKDVIAGVVFCWIMGKLLPSVWQLAPCEQCVCRKAWTEEKKIHDPEQYRGGESLARWNPFKGRYEPFEVCRCMGTGLDPWVYRVEEKMYANEQGPLVKTASVGSASLMIHRRVFEKIRFPWFSFLYHENRRILLTEDHYFCWQAREAGFEIWADKSMPCGHFKTLDLLQINETINLAFKLGGEHALGKPLTLEAVK